MTQQEIKSFSEDFVSVLDKIGKCEFLTITRMPDDDLIAMVSGNVNDSVKLLFNACLSSELLKEVVEATASMLYMDKLRHEAFEKQALDKFSKL